MIEGDGAVLLVDENDEGNDHDDAGDGGEEELELGEEFVGLGAGVENFDLVAEEVGDETDATITASEIIREGGREGISLAEISEFG